MWNTISLLLLPESMQMRNSISSIIVNSFSADFWGRWQSYVWLYLALTVASHITLSPPDLEGSVDGGVVIVGGALLSFLLFGWCGVWEKMVIEFFKSAFFSSISIFSFVIFLLGIFCIVCKIITGKSE
jgi:phosphotransferase system  glucose/maltose/N-acetylglucosamine-specific IIC component